MIAIRPLASWLLAALAAAAAGAATTAGAQETLRVGELNSYKAQPAFLEPYRKGMELAVDEINAGGGVGGRKLRLMIEDDHCQPADGVSAFNSIMAAAPPAVLGAV